MCCDKRRHWTCEASARDGEKDVNLADVHGRTPLLVAATKGRIGITRKLLSIPNIEVNASSDGASGASPVHHAIYKGHTDYVKPMFRMEDIDVNMTNICGQTSLCIAAYSGHVAIVTMLLNSPTIDVNAATDWRASPLSWRHIKVAPML